MHVMCAATIHTGHVVVASSSMTSWTHNSHGHCRFHCNNENIVLLCNTSHAMVGRNCFPTCRQRVPTAGWITVASVHPRSWHLEFVVQIGWSGASSDTNLPLWPLIVELTKRISTPPGMASCVLIKLIWPLCPGIMQASCASLVVACKLLVKLAWCVFKNSSADTSLSTSTLDPMDLCQSGGSSAGSNQTQQARH